MVLVLSHLFGRRFLHANFKRNVHECPMSKVILEDLPQTFADALEDYNRQVTDVFSQYLATVAAELIAKDRGEENKLPLSGIEFPKEASLITEDIDERDTIKNLARYSVAYIPLVRHSLLCQETRTWNCTRRGTQQHSTYRRKGGKKTVTTKEICTN
ncbi:putative ATP-dependent RNA helicase ddx60 [Desmophyllum pertusum]|uniref:ATP-dependent RNA helicase ddx60 n=1 Tax=Desmophyllum pertusum TaxID=174260 RepID=A0A9W9ZS47_9CNID|nr:putative ATP-dependent RNA helicase ddx60 [Desmophyllum pertusum]